MKKVAPSYSEARALPTPPVSEPQSGWPPTQRRSSSGVSARMRGPLVLPTSLTTAPAGAAASAALTSSTTRRTGVHTKTMSAPETASARLPQARVTAPRSSARSMVAWVWVKPRTSATPTRSRAARPSEPPMRPTPMTATVLPARSLIASDGLAGPAREVQNATRVLAEHGRGQRLGADAQATRHAVTLEHVTGSGLGLERLEDRHILVEAGHHDASTDGGQCRLNRRAHLRYPTSCSIQVSNGRSKHNVLSLPGKLSTPARRTHGLRLHSDRSQRRGERRAGEERARRKDRAAPRLPQPRRPPGRRGAARSLRRARSSPARLSPRR